MKNRIIPFFICIIFFAATFLSACSSTSSEVITIKFNEDFQYKKYDGREVKIRGYMSTMSPMDGKFLYLMNIPYQSCPFCLPNTTTIMNTIAVYAPSGQRFEFYDGAVEITGKVMVGDIKDEFGYQYPFKIVNATYTKIDTSQLSENLKTYGALSQDGIINDVIKISGQVDYNSFFEMYRGTSSDIKIVNGDEFDAVIKRINAVSKTDYIDIIEILERFKEYNEIVNTNIEAEKYSENSTLDMEEKIIKLFNDLYSWLNKFEI